MRDAREAAGVSGRLHLIGAVTSAGAHGPGQEEAPAAFRQVVGRRQPGARSTRSRLRCRRYAVILRPEWLSLSTWVVAFTSTRARKTSFRPAVEIDGRRTLVMCDQLATVDLNRLAERAGFLTLKEMQRIDDALALVLDL